MGVYPLMVALLDIERANEGIHKVRDLQVRGELGHGNAFWWGTVHELDLTNEADTFGDKVAWVNSGPADADWENPERILAFSLGRLTGPYRWEHCFLTLGITLEDQLPLPPQVRDRYVLAVIGFSGQKGGTLLPAGHPVHPVMMAFLEATQPIYAVATGDCILPQQPESADFFSQPWQQDYEFWNSYQSMYYGPELLPFIPPNLLSMTAGLAHVEPLEAGVWVTFPGWNTNAGKVPGPGFESHRAALSKINAALRQMPTPPWAE